jgi:hypothetical protein
MGIELHPSSWNFHLALFRAIDYEECYNKLETRLYAQDRGLFRPAEYSRKLKDVWVYKRC